MPTEPPTTHKRSSEDVFRSPVTGTDRTTTDHSISGILNRRFSRSDRPPATGNRGLDITWGNRVGSSSPCGASAGLVWRLSEGIRRKRFLDLHRASRPSDTRASTLGNAKTHAAQDRHARRNEVAAERLLLIVGCASNTLDNPLGVGEESALRRLATSVRSEASRSAVAKPYRCGYE
jgi:hypothetical protein